MNKKECKQKCEKLEIENSVIKDIFYKGIHPAYGGDGQETTPGDDRTDNFNFLDDNARRSNALEVMKVLDDGKKIEEEWKMREILTKQKSQSEDLKVFQKKQKRYDRFIEKHERDWYQLSAEIEELRKDIRDLQAENRKTKAKLKKSIQKLEKKNKKMKSDIRFIKKFFVYAAVQKGCPPADFRQVMKYMLKHMKAERKKSGLLEIGCNGFD